MALDLKSGFLVGDCEVKPMLGQVVGQNGPVHVEPEVMDVLPLTRHGKVRYELKTPYSDGTTHVIFEPLEFIRHILVPNPCGTTRGSGARNLQFDMPPAGRDAITRIGKLNSMLRY